jgi:hypothetical protein
MFLFAHSTPRSRRERPVRRSEIESSGVEVTAAPFRVLVVLWVARVREGFEKMSVPVGPADILRRTRACASKDSGIPRAGARSTDRFEDQIVFPPIPKIVLVDQLVSRHAKQALNPNAPKRRRAAGSNRSLERSVRH